MFGLRFGAGFGRMGGRKASGGTPTPTPTPTPAPTWSVVPSISGTPTVGQTLTGSDGTISNGTVSARAWLRGASAISGATGATYLLVEADEGEDISFRVTANGAGGSAQATSDPVGPIAPAPDITAPTITSANSSGSYVEGVAIGGTLTADEAVTWAVTGTDAAAVTLDPDTGVWSLEETDYATQDSYSFSFVATDLAENDSDPQVVAITITEDVAPTINAPQLILSSATTYPPPLEAVIDETGIVGVDYLRVQASLTLDFASPFIDEAVLTVDNGEPLIVPGLSSIESPDETYFRALVERGAHSSDWSIIVKHGDTTAPVFTSSASPTVNENVVNPTGTLTFSDPDDVVSVIISGGADSDLFSLVGLTWTLNATPDYETKSSYVVPFLATDRAGNQATQTMTLGINDVTELTPTTLSPTNKSSFLTLSNGNLTVSSNLAGVGAAARVRGTQTRNFKAYFEAIVGTLFGNAEDAYIGVCTGSVSMSGYGAGSAGISCLRNNGEYWADGAFTGSNAGLAFVQGNVIMVAYDPVANKIWFGKNGTWVGDPVAGTGGIGLPTSTEDFFPLAMLVPRATGNQNVVTFNFGAADFIYPIPSGFGAFT